MIKPEIGMPVLYHPHADDHFGTAPCAGIVARVWGDNMVNLAIVDGSGLVQSRTSVFLYHPEDGQPQPTGGRWCQFPNWFLRMQAPRFFGPAVAGLSALNAQAAHAVMPGSFFEHHVSFQAPLGSPDKVTG